MKLEPVELPAPGAAEALIRQTAIGVNFMDVYHRGGQYPLPMPSGIGVEAAGVIESVGSASANKKASVPETSAFLLPAGVPL